MSTKKIKFDYNPNYNSNSGTSRRGIKDTFVNTNYTGLDPEIEYQEEIDGPGNKIIGATSLEELDLIENTIENTIENNIENNIDDDPFKPMFLDPSKTLLKHNKIITPPPKSNLDLTINEFSEKISASIIGIINDLLDGNFNSISDLLLKNDRGIATAILFIFISLFLIFFTI